MITHTNCTIFIKKGIAALDSLFSSSVPLSTHRKPALHLELEASANSVEDKRCHAAQELFGHKQHRKTQKIRNRVGGSDPQGTRIDTVCIFGACTQTSIFDWNRAAGHTQNTHRALGWTFASNMRQNWKSRWTPAPRSRSFLIGNFRNMHERRALLPDDDDGKTDSYRSAALSESVCVSRRWLQNDSGLSEVVR